jgi:hypothetical protein
MQITLDTCGIILPERLRRARTAQALEAAAMAAFEAVSAHRVACGADAASAASDGTKIYLNIMKHNLQPSISPDLVANVRSICGADSPLTQPSGDSTDLPGFYRDTRQVAL